MKQKILMSLASTVIGSALPADEYRFIVETGTPTAAESVQVASPAIALDTSESSAFTSGKALEARFFTTGTSVGIGIDPTKNIGSKLILR